MEGGQTNVPDPSMLQPGSGTGSNPTTAPNLDMGALTLTQLVQQFSVTHPVLHRIPFFFQISGQPYPVEEIAKRLVGHYLRCKESNLVLRILETEAFQEGEDLYKWRFHAVAQNFRVEAGTLDQYTTILDQNGLVITTGHDESGDVVLLRTCEPIYGYEEVVSRLGLRNKRLSKYKRANLMTGPSSVYKVLQPDLGNKRDLFDPSQGIHLLQKGPDEQIIFEGLRVIPKDSTRFNHSLMTGLDKYFRFALAGVPQKYREATSLRPIFDAP